MTDIKVNDGYWHFLCVTWESGYGIWRVFVDGILEDNGIRLAQGTIVPGKAIRRLSTAEDNDIFIEMTYRIARKEILFTKHQKELLQFLI